MMMMLTMILIIMMVIMNILLVYGIDAPREIYICESSDPNFIGTYKESSELVDGAPIYTNAKVVAITAITTIVIIITTIIIITRNVYYYHYYYH